MSEAFAAVVERIREQVTPNSEECERLRQATAALIDRTEAALSDLPVDADIIRVGSTARGTWLAGDRDVDLFVRFPTDIDREQLESYGLQIGQTVLPNGREEYAEHPYTVGEFQGFDVDLVPCYDVDSATEIKSAVDRTPFHTEYLETRLNDAIAADVRVTKAFLKGIGVYGSDLKTCGFSGYLTELLVLEYGGFREFIEAAADWHPQVELDPESHGQETFDDPLVVIDPTDPERNVAAALSTENVARLQHYARDLLSEPRADLFKSAFTSVSSSAETNTDAETDTEALSAEQFRTAVEDRGTTPVAICFDAPDIVDDQLWPQLRKSLDGLVGELERRGFDVFRAAPFADESAVLFVELAVSERPRVERHEGPPVHARDYAADFYDKYAETSDYGPFIEGDRYVVEREREFQTAKEFLESDAIFDVALGAHVESALEAGYDVLVAADSARLVDEFAFGPELARYISPKP